MHNKPFRQRMLLVSYIALLALVVLKFNQVISALSFVLSALSPVFIGFALAFILSRPCTFFHRQFGRLLGKKQDALARVLAVVACYVSLLLVVTLAFVIVLPQLYQSIASLVDTISDNLPAMEAWINEQLVRFELTQLNLHDLLPSLKDIVTGVVDTLSSTLPHIISFTGSLLSSSVTLLSGLMLSVYMLFSRGKLSRQFSRLLTAYTSPRTAQSTMRVMRLSADTFTKFISGQLLEACILGMLCFIGMSLFRFQYAPLISVIIAITAIVPIVGAYIGAAISALLLVMVDPMQALWFLIFLVILQQLEGNLIYPRVVGSSIGLPGLWVLIAIVVGGSLFGVTGMLLSVPTVSVLYTLIRQDVNRRMAKKQNGDQK